MMIWTITGIAIIGVIALMGIVPAGESELIQQQRRAMTDPDRAVAGNNTEWFDVRYINRAMCGTISPINPIGPQKAVTTAVSRLEMVMSQFRVARMFTPRFSA